jgi:hypothetical protein
MSDLLTTALRRSGESKVTERRLAKFAVAGDDSAAQTAKAKAPADDAGRRGVPLIGAMGGAIRSTRPDAMIAAMDTRRGCSDLLGDGLDGIPFLEVK